MPDTELDANDTAADLPIPLPDLTDPTSATGIPAIIQQATPFKQTMLILSALGYKQSEIAQRLRTDAPYVCKVLKELDPQRVFRTSPQFVKDLTIARSQYLRHRALDRIGATIDDAKARDAAVVYGILHDKERDLASQGVRGEKDANTLLSRLATTTAAPAALLPPDDETS